MNSHILSKDQIDIVLYHGNCADGFGSAFCVWLYYKRTWGKDSVFAQKIVYKPCFYSTEPLKDEFITELTGKNILMCDFSYKYDQLVQIINVCNTFMILDHHKTSAEDLKSINSELKIFDQNRSGAGITWDFFFPSIPLPTFLTYIQDRDLWTRSLKQTDAFSTYLHAQKFDFELFEEFLNDTKLAEVIQIGQMWSEYRDILIQNIIKRVSYVIQEIDSEYKIVLYLNTADFVSDVANKLFTRYPFGDFSAIHSYDLHRNITYFSLRSTSERSDVSLIAQRLGGGGHRNASGLGIVGIAGSLPYKCIPDYEILTFIQHKNLGPVIYSKINNKKIGYVYTLYKLSVLNEIIFEKKYMDLIKTKTSDSKYVIFETATEEIGYVPSTKIVTPIKKYFMFMNEFYTSENNALTKLVISALNQSDQFTEQSRSFMEFKSIKEFSDIFSEIEHKEFIPILEKNQHDADSISGSGSDVDSDLDL